MADAIQSEAAPEPDNSRAAWFSAGDPDDTAPEKEVAEGEAAPVVEADGDAPEVEGAADAELAPANPLDEPPEFWSKERKALWAKADPELRQAILDHDKEARSNSNKRIEEAANLRKQAETLSAQAIKDRDDLANWWKDTGPKLANQFRDKWNIDWKALAEQDPARYTVLKEEREQEAAMLGETIRKHEAEVEQSNKRAATAHQEVRRAEHEKLATELPTYFGKPEVAQKTYDDIAGYLVEQGVPKDRIPNIYEAAVVKIALKAMRFDKAQKAAAAIKPQAAAKTEGVEVQPGPKPAQTGPTSQVEREAMKKLRNGGRLNRDEASRAFA